MGHRHCIHNQRVTAEAFHFKAKALEVSAVGVECLTFGRPEMESEREQQSLSGGGASLQRIHELFVQHALVSRVLIDEDKTILMLERDVSAAQLEQRGHNHWGPRRILFRCRLS
jgi:hypothetical protein